MVDNVTATQLYWSVAGCGLFYIVVFFGVYYLRGRSVLKRWAYENGFQILKSKTASSFAGSLTWNYGQTIFYIQVRDKNGKVRDGWVRCGSFWAGVWSNKTEIRWKDEL